MFLTKYFSLEELCVTQHQEYDNTPLENVIENLVVLAETLERARVMLEGRPIIINSGYRSEVINTLVGGSKNSAHMQGWAADFICPAFGSPVAVARRLDSAGLQFDQLIYERTWVHLSVDPRMRREVLTAHFVKGKPTTYTTGIQET